MRPTIVLWSCIKLTMFELPYFHNTIVTLEGYYSIVHCNTFMTKFGPININGGTKNQHYNIIENIKVATLASSITFVSGLPLLWM